MAYSTDIQTSLHGRRLGLQFKSSGQTGFRGAEFLVGPEAFREGVSSAATGSTIAAHGVTVLAGTSEGSSAVYEIAPPIPGVTKTIVVNPSTNGPMYLKTGGLNILSSIGSTQQVIKSSTIGGGVYRLIGVTTAIWAALGITSGTSSNAGGHLAQATT